MRMLGKAIVPALLVAAVYYAVFGGEYSLFELREARASVDSARAELVRLQSDIDSLQAWSEALRDDSATLERVARERFGMIREGEVLYRFAAPPDSTSSDEDER